MTAQRPAVRAIAAALLAVATLCLFVSRCRGRAAETRRLELALERLEEERTALELVYSELEKGRR